MQSFASLTLLVSVALSSAFASPVQQRANSINCEPTPRGPYQLITGNSDPNAKYPTVFSLGNTTTTDHYGDQAKVVISSKDDGSPFGLSDPETIGFEFLSCNSAYMDTKQEGEGGYEATLYGIIRPQGETQHCLQASSGSVESASVFTNSRCSYSDDKSQQDQTWYYFPNDGTIRFVSTRLAPGSHQHNTYLTRSDVGHNAMTLNAGSGESDGIEVNFAS